MNKLFALGELFVSSTGDVDLQQKDINGRGHFLINSGLENHGIKGKTDKKAKVFPANTITVDFWGNAYYRDFEYKMATHNHVFSLSGTVIKNKKVGLYLQCMLSKLQKLFSYNNMATWTKLKSIEIELPVVESSDPNHKYTVNDIDWQYMQDRIAELEQDRIAELDAYLKATGLDDYELTDEDKKALSLSPKSTSDKADALENDSQNGQIRFKKYVMHDIFEPIKVKKAKKADVRDYKTAEFCVPVVYAKFGDNGIMYWGRKGEFTAFGNVISIVYNGVISAGKVYAQEEPTGILAESYLIRYKYGDIPFLANLYMAQVIEHKIYPLYSRENLATWNNRVENEVIELPITSSGDINFGHMERYIRAIEKLTIAGVVKFRDREIAAARQAVNA